MTARFHESQFVDAKNGWYGLKMILPVPAVYEGLDMLPGFTLPIYEGPDAGKPATGDCWLVINPQGKAYALPVNLRDVGQLGAWAWFKKQNGLAFVHPSDMQSFALVYQAV